jgi:hypothetical protein
MMRINIINNPITMPEDFTISFGLQATPVKPRPANWRSWNCASWDLPWRENDPKRFFNFNLGGVNGQGEMDGDWWSISPAWLIPPKTMKSQKYNPDSPKMWLPFSSTTFLGLRTYTTKNKYNFLPEWRVYKNEWEIIPKQINLGQAPGWSEASINTTKSYSDFYVYYLNKFFKNYDVSGIYLDSWQLCAPTENLGDGYGYIDRHGKLKPTYPILAARKLQRRIYTIINKYRGKRGIVLLNVETNLLMPVLGFVSGSFDGECFTWSDLSEKIEKSGWYSSALRPNLLRGTFDMKPFGLVPTFDCRLYLTASKHEDDQNVAARELFGLLLANDIQSWGSDTEGFARTIGITLDWWGITGKDVKFLPYWAKNPAVTVSFTPDGKTIAWKNQCYASAYINKREKKILIVALNTSNDWLTPSQKNFGYYLKLNLNKLGLKGKKIVVSNAETLGMNVKLPYKNGIIPLTMPSHEMKLISITWGGKKGHNFFSFLKDKSIGQ